MNTGKLTGNYAMGVLTGNLFNGRLFGAQRGHRLWRCHCLGSRCCAGHRSGYSVAVQGFGNVGRYTVKNFIKLGGKVVAVAEWELENGNYAIYNPEGFCFERWKATGCGNQLLDFLTPKPSPWTSLGAGCMVPAAWKTPLMSDRPSGIRARLVVEAANGPITPAAGSCQFVGIAVTPDILSNAEA